jgi:hypothetical protein
VNGVQRGCKCVCSVDASPRCPTGRKNWHQETLGYSSGHGAYGAVVWVESEIGGGGVGGREAGGSVGRCVWDFYAASTTQKAMEAAGCRLNPSWGASSG